VTNANDRAKLDQIAIYLFGKTEQLIEDHARSSQVSTTELAERMANLLLAQTNGSVLRSHDQVSRVRTNGARQRTGAEPMEVARRTRRGASALKRTNPTLKGYSYNGTHWTQQLRNKKRLREQMQRIRAKRSRG
jgi:hypothetical protein